MVRTHISEVLIYQRASFLGMGSQRESVAGTRFNCSITERAAFEAGIKIATIYHQFVGIPFSDRNRTDLEHTIEECIWTQPYVSAVKVKITGGGDKSDQYTYASLTGDMIDATVTILIDETEVTAKMRYDNSLHYPLMYISSVSIRPSRTTK